MDDNLIDFFDIGHDRSSYSPSSRPILRANLSAFDDASYQSSTIYAEVPHVTSLDTQAHRTTDRIPDLSVTDFDDAIAPIAKESFGLQDVIATSLSSGLSPGGINSLYSDNNVWLDQTKVEGWHRGSESALQDIHASTSSNHRVVAGSTSHCSFGNFTALDNLETFDNSDNFLDPRLGNLSSAAREYNVSGLDDLWSLVEPIETSFGLNEFGLGVPSDIGHRQQEHQPPAAKLSEPTEMSCPMPSPVKEYHPKPNPSESLRNYNDPSIVNSWDVFQSTSFNGKADQPMHEDEAVPLHRRRKASPRSRQSSTDEKFPCSVCTTFSGDVPSLIEHMRCHNRSHVCRAPGCTRRFSTPRDLTRHTKSAHSNTVLTCSICFAIIRGNRMDNLQRHIRNRHSAQALAQASPSDCSSWSSPGGYTSM